MVLVTDLEVVQGSDPLDAMSILYCAADFNRDGDVNGPDMSQLVGEYGETICSNTCNGDFDTDGDVYGKDFPCLSNFLGNQGVI